MNAARKEEIIRLARQISRQSLQLKGIVENVVRRSSASASEPASQFRASQYQQQPQVRRTSSSKVQLSGSSRDAIRVESQILTESSSSNEGVKIPTTTHISTRLVPEPPPPPPEKEPEHPRPYEDDPIWDVWESNMLRLIQLLKMLLLELKNVSDYTQIDTPAEVSITDSLLANKYMASRIIGGFQNREQVSQAVNNPPPKPSAPKVEEMPEQRPEQRPEQIDLGTYFKKLAIQMDALTKSLKPNPSPPHAGAPTQARLIPLEERVGRLAHNLAGVSKAIAKPVEDVGTSMDNVLRSTDQTAETQPMQKFRLQTQQQPQLQLQLLPELQAQLHALLQPQLQTQLMQNRNNVSFLLDRSDSSSVPSMDIAGNTVSSRLSENVKTLIDYMKLVNSELKNAVGSKPPPPRMSIAEEEEIRDAIQSLCRNMNRMSKEMRCTLDENTCVAGSRLVDDSKEPVARRRRRRR